MKIAGLIKRVEPLVLKLSGRLTLCPWTSVLFALDPRTLGVHSPEMNIEVTGEDGALKKLRFGSRHESWFPASTRVNLELWNEYLSVFWQHRSNAHFYLNHGTVIRPGDVVIDCGCCEGFFVFQALEAGASKVIGIEPNPEMVHCLEKTFAEEIKAGRVVIQAAALGSFHGQASFSFNAAYPAFGQVGDQAGGQPVAVETLVSICERLKLDRVDFVKMDIEGAEIQAMEGALPVLAKFHPKLAITTYHRAFDFRCLEALLRTAGYKHIRAVGITKFGGDHNRPILLHTA
ncbi:MAG: FkbM family methyltransferase [Verrucomicrobiia bacterium]